MHDAALDDEEYDAAAPVTSKPPPLPVKIVKVAPLVPVLFPSLTAYTILSLKLARAVKAAVTSFIDDSRASNTLSYASRNACRGSYSSLKSSGSLASRVAS